MGRRCAGRPHRRDFNSSDLCLQSGGKTLQAGKRMEFELFTPEGPPIDLCPQIKNAEPRTRAVAKISSPPGIQYRERRQPFEDFY